MIISRGMLFNVNSPISTKNKTEKKKHKARGGMELMRTAAHTYHIWALETYYEFHTC